VNYVFISADKNRHFLNAIFLRPVHPVRGSQELFPVFLRPVGAPLFAVRWNCLLFFSGRSMHTCSLFW
jgi:hypothetical protein